MGYSNNKWRKLLTILMIVNLCFILFSKISCVFGATDYTTVTIDNSLYDINISYITKDFKYYFLDYRTYKNSSSGKTRYCVDLFCSNYEMTFTGSTVENIGDIHQIYLFKVESWSNFSSCVNSFNSTTFDKSLGNHDYINNSSINVSQSYASSIILTINYGYINITLANYDVKNKTGDIIFNNNVFISPYFDNLTEIENGYPDGVFISRGSYSEDDALYFHLLKITNTVPDGNQSTYYYDSKVFKLTKDSKYYKTYDADTDNNYSYYYIKRSALTLDTNSSYLYVLSNSGNSISNSYGILQPDIPGGIYDVVQSDTAGVITEQQALNDKMSNINNNQQDIANSQQEIANNSNNINNFLNENTVSSDTENDVDTNLNFNNTSPQFAELQTNFFSRLSNIIADFGDYSLDTIDTINIPIPHSSSTIPLTSDLMTSHIPNNIKFIITAFWCFIFGKYFLNYLLLVYKLITTGQLIDYYSSNDEIIVTNVL